MYDGSGPLRQLPPMLNHVKYLYTSAQSWNPKYLENVYVIGVVNVFPVVLPLTIGYGNNVSPYSSQCEHVTSVCGHIPAVKNWLLQMCW